MHSASSFAGFVLCCGIMETMYVVGPLAYLDPGTGSLILQVVLGVVLGALLTIKLYWGRFKAFTVGLLGRRHRNERQTD